MRDRTKAAIAWAVIMAAAVAAETITASAHSTMWEEANGIPIINEVEYTAEDIDLLARMAWAEARGEGQEGMRLVVAVAINRLNDDRFPNSLSEIIVPGQFVTASWAPIEAVNAVYAELAEASNDEILYFRSGHYHDFGTPVIKVGRHYFSK